MVEGDGCHRVAREHRKTILGAKLIATSPNGRFKAGAAAIMKAGGVLLRIEVHGKNLFYFFGKKGGSAALVVHIHFGMAGAFAVYQGEEPETTANTRLRLVSQSGTRLAAHLSAMTVEHGTVASFYDRLVAKLGPDPLRDDASPTSFVLACIASKKPIGMCMMDQSYMAGVGNIYRSEVLYEAGIHPEQPANSLERAVLLRLWATVVKQMQAGFTTGSIWGHKKGASCYGRKVSAAGGKVVEWKMGGRNVFACSKRQQLTQSRRAAVAKPLRVRTGTAHLKRMTSAAAAETRKRRSGEGLAVQHVALKNDATRALALKALKAKQRPPKKQKKLKSLSRKRTSDASNSSAKRSRS